jgi:hypothetical protein
MWPLAAYYNLVGRVLKSHYPVDVVFGVNEEKFKRILIVRIKLNDNKSVDFNGSLF